MSEKSEYKISVGDTACDFSRETFLISPTETTLEKNPINLKKSETSSSRSILFYFPFREYVL